MVHEVRIQGEGGGSKYGEINVRKRLFVAGIILVTFLFVFTSCESTSTTILPTTPTYQTTTTTPALITTSQPSTSIVTPTYQVPTTTTPALTSTTEPEPTSTITEVKVMSVIDGDTIEIDIQGEIYRVRYIGIDTPELDDTRVDFRVLAEEATAYNRQLVENKTIQLEKDISEFDKYGRLLRYVYVDDVFVNAELVAQGFARVETYEPDIKYKGYFEELEVRAKQAGIGIWRTDLPITTTPTPSAVEIQDVQITKIFYDGLVPRVESDEYVEIKNFGDKPQNLLGWVLRDISEGYPSFTFPDYVLGTGQSIRVYTNEIHPEYGGFSFGRGSAIWNNSEPDTAALYDSNGNEVSRKSY